MISTIDRLIITLHVSWPLLLRGFSSALQHHGPIYLPKKAVLSYQHLKNTMCRILIRLRYMYVCQSKKVFQAFGVELGIPIFRGILLARTWDFCHADLVQFGSEKSLGILKAPSKFTIHTKAPGLKPGALKRESILAGASKSFQELGVDSVRFLSLFPRSCSPRFLEVHVLVRAGTEMQASLVTYLGRDIFSSCARSNGAHI